MTLAAPGLEAQSLTAFYYKDAEQLAKVGQGIEAAIVAGKKLKKSQGELRHYHALHILNMWRLGRVLEDIAPHGGPRLQGVNLDVTLRNLGIDPRLSARARKVAEVDYEDLRVFIEESGDDINLSHLLRLQTESTTPPPEWNDDKEWRMVLTVVRDYLEQGKNDWRLHKARVFLENE